MDEIVGDDVGQTVLKATLGRWVWKKREDVEGVWDLFAVRTESGTPMGEHRLLTVMSGDGNLENNLLHIASCSPDALLTSTDQVQDGVKLARLQHLERLLARAGELAKALKIKLREARELGQHVYQVCNDQQGDWGDVN